MSKKSNNRVVKYGYNGLIRYEIPNVVPRHPLCIDASENEHRSDEQIKLDSAQGLAKIAIVKMNTKMGYGFGRVLDGDARGHMCFVHEKELDVAESAKSAAIASLVAGAIVYGEVIAQTGKHAVPYRAQNIIVETPVI